MEKDEITLMIGEQVSIAVVALKRDIDSLLKRVQEDNEKLLKENYALSKEIKALKTKVDDHVDTLVDYCPHTSV